MEAYHREEAARGPMVLERLSDLREAVGLLGEFKDIRGMTVVSPMGEEVGRVDHLYMDPKQGEITMASISFGGVWGFGAKQILVPMDQLELVDEERIRLMTTPEIVKGAPEFEELEGGDFTTYCDYWHRERAKAEQAEAAQKESIEAFASEEGD